MSYSERVDKFHERPHGKQIDNWLEEHACGGGRTVVDYGCGTGIWLGNMSRQYLSGRFLGVEPNPQLRRIAQLRAPKCEIVPDAEQFIRRYVRPHAITCSQVLGHCDDPELELDRMYRMLRHDGKLLLVIPSVAYARTMALSNLFSGYKHDPTLQHMWTLGDMEEVLYYSGFKLVNAFALGGRKLFARESHGLVAQKR